MELEHIFRPNLNNEFLALQNIGYTISDLAKLFDKTITKKAKYTYGNSILSTCIFFFFINKIVNTITKIKLIIPKILLDISDNRVFPLRLNISKYL